MTSEGFSLQPDEHMRWIYDSYDPRYHSEEAKDLRERRAAALRQCPKHMIDEAWLNDKQRRREKK